MHVRDLPEGYLDVTSVLGRSKARELVVAPASADGVVQAVTELGFLRRLDAVELDALGRTSEAIAAAIRTARDRSRLEELLEEVQRQTEELQVQQEAAAGVELEFLGLVATTAADGLALALGVKETRCGSPGTRRGHHGRVERRDRHGRHGPPAAAGRRRGTGVAPPFELARLILVVYIANLVWRRGREG